MAMVILSLLALYEKEHICSEIGTNRYYWHPPLREIHTVVSVSAIFASKWRVSRTDYINKL